MTGFGKIARAPARCYFGATVHDGKFYVLQGFDGVSTGGKQFVDCLRSTDLISFDRVATNMPHWAWGHLVSFGGELIRGPGFDGTYPQTPNDDNCTGQVYASSDGVTWEARSTLPPYEMGGLLVHDGYLYNFGGIQYGGAGPSRFMSNMSHRASDVTSWSQRSSSVFQPNGTMYGRAGFGFASWGGKIWTVAGEDYQVPYVYGDCYVSDDGLQSLVLANTDMPYGQRVGCDLVPFKGRLALLHGTDAAGINHSKQVWSTDNADVSVKASWYRHPDLPFEGASGSCAVPFTIGGTEYLVVYGGRTFGGLRGGIWISETLDGPWQELRGSDLWVI